MSHLYSYFSFIHSKNIGYVKMSFFELRAMYILTILSTGKSEIWIKKIPLVDLLNVPP